MWGKIAFNKEGNALEKGKKKSGKALDEFFFQE